jgi:hypothetical protein
VLQLIDGQVPVARRVEDVEAAGLRVVGREGHRQQAVLALVEVDQARDVEERARDDPAVLDA